MQRTISIKINPPKDLFLEYLQVCSEIYNKYIEWSFKKRSYSKVLAHNELYNLLRKEYPTINAALIQTIRDNALENVKALKFKFKPLKKPTSHIRYDKRSIALKNNKLSFCLFDKRYKENITIPDFFKEKYKDWKFQAATIGYDRIKGHFVANLIFKEKSPEQILNVPQNRIIGVDRGIYNIIALSDGTKYNSKRIRKIKRKNLYLKRQLQAKGTKSAKRKLKALSGYEKRFSLNENHIIANLLAALPYDIFVLEDLTGIKEQGRKSKKKKKEDRKKFADWSFWQLELILKYKLEALGKYIIKIDPRYTSQMCSNCNKICKSNRNGSIYCCKFCGYSENADINAAINIRNLYLKTINFIDNQNTDGRNQEMLQAAVDQPIVSRNEDFPGTSQRF